MADIDFGQLSEALNDKSDRDLRNVDTTAKADAVIDYQEPTSANNYTWYRKYKSGWVEQGGCVTSPSDSAYIVSLPMAMANTNYTVMITRDTGTSEYGTNNINARWQTVYNKTTTTFTTWGTYGGRPNFMWQLTGQAAN